MSNNRRRTQTPLVVVADWRDGERTDAYAALYRRVFNVALDRDPVAAGLRGDGEVTGVVRLARPLNDGTVDAAPAKGVRDGIA